MFCSCSLLRIRGRMPPYIPGVAAAFFVSALLARACQSANEEQTIYPRIGDRDGDRSGDVRQQRRPAARQVRRRCLHRPPRLRLVPVRPYDAATRALALCSSLSIYAHTSYFTTYGRPPAPRSQAIHVCVIFQRCLQVRGAGFQFQRGQRFNCTFFLPSRSRPSAGIIFFLLTC